MDIFKDQKVIDFGNVCIDTKTIKNFTVYNSTSINQVFKAERYLEDIPRLDCGFNIIPKISSIIKPGETFNFKIELAPKYVTIKSSDLFVIKHLYGIQEIVFTKANVIERPKISLSCRKMQIICSQHGKKSKRCELINSGNCPAYFQFIGDNNNSYFNISPSQGKIVPSKSIHVTFSCRLADAKPVFRRVFCLISYHEPISLDIYVLNSLSKGSLTQNLPEDTLTNYANGYISFMHDTMTSMVKNTMPPISLEKYYFDFGSCQLNYQKHVFFSLINNYDENLTFRWLRYSLENIFNLEPMYADVEKGKSVVFKITFKPSARYELYNTSVEGNLFCDLQLIPFPASIHLKGNSFDELDCGWAAQYRVEPRNLVVPPCSSSPFEPSYSTLVIHKEGHLPLAYKFHPPPNTNFKVKPQQGLIQDKFQLVLVQFYPKKLNDAMYKEKWMISFNSNENFNQCDVEFCGTIETPHLVINNGQDIVFPKAHPRTPCKLLVDLYNPNRKLLKYRFEVLKGKKLLDFDTTGEVWPYEHKQVLWIFQPQGIGFFEGLVSCTPFTDIYGEAVKVTTVLVKATCEETELKVIPSSLLFYNVLCGYEHERGFEIINNGDSVIKGDFVCVLENEELCKYVNVNFQPKMFALDPGCSVLISVYATVSQKGSIDCDIGFTTNRHSPTALLKMSIICVFPQLEITDIRLKNTGPLFSKYNFWKMLEINQLNRVLKNMSEGSKEEVYMQLPSYTVSSQTISIEMLVENQSEVGLKLSITQKAVCDCKPKLTQVSFSRSKWIDNCPHKNQLKMFPASKDIDPRGSTVLQMDVLYSTPGEVKFLFILCITPDAYKDVNSYVELKLVRTSIPEGIPFLDTPEPKENNNLVFVFRPVFIGEIYPFTQAFTIYNNTNQMVDYEVDDTNLQGTPFEYIGERDTISTLSNHWMLFTFLPYSCGTFEAEIVLTINDNESRIVILRGTGVPTASMPDEMEEDFGTKADRLAILHPKPVFMSTSHLNVGPIKPTSSQKHMMFLNNKTKDSLSFKWYVTNVAGVVELRVVPSKGTVQPEGMIMFRIMAFTRGACHVTATLTCVYASLTQYSAACEAHLRYREEVLATADQFVITERGTERITPVPPSDSWPPKHYITVSVTVDVRNKYKDANELLPISPNSIQSLGASPLNSLKEMADEYRLMLTVVLECVIWEALVDLAESEARWGREGPSIHYCKLRDCKRCEVVVPARIYQVVMEDVIYSAWCDVFDIRGSEGSSLRRSSRSFKCSEDSNSKGAKSISISESVTSRWGWSSRIKSIGMLE